ncbi:hypothetical protein SNOG_06044 [Parastagonospora nodorum SN15]|uniref:Uncharacterized protein n=1 Tax=Phaeosphaeria nodorum (strain SN15 / ATCC MYA-4574 / FGSC 10173) TaxID=321614 RepID=Q0UQC0_PHANO|nr:hypothetical protein SNOG_06044 [Parastagonospora nodorum SN15]EAT87108.1 hypothetical protein SNOG_06044 [Parastagonospora nodorum SN15]
MAVVAPRKEVGGACHYVTCLSLSGIPARSLKYLPASPHLQPLAQAPFVATTVHGT